MTERTKVYHNNYKARSGRDAGDDRRKVRKAIRKEKSSACRNHQARVARRSWDWRKICIFVVLSLFLMAGGIGICSAAMDSRGSSVVEANHPLSDVKYTVVKIQYGDSLWSIAKEHMTPGFSDIYEYIDEIKRCNQLDSDHITSGGYLMIPYYEDLSL